MTKHYEVSQAYAISEYLSHSFEPGVFSSKSVCYVLYKTIFVIYLTDGLIISVCKLCSGIRKNLLFTTLLHDPYIRDFC